MNDDKILSQLSRRIDIPFESRHIRFFMTNQCNLRCDYCYHTETKKNHQRLSFVTAKRFLDYYIKHQANINLQNFPIQISFTGGEPTLETETILSIIDYLNSSQLSYAPIIITNGVISREKLTHLTIRNIRLQISFDDLQNIHRFDTCGRSVNKTILKTIDIVAKEKLLYSLRSTLTEKNYRQICDVVNFASQHNVSRLFFSFLFMRGQALQNQAQLKRPLIAEYLEYLKEAMRIAEEKNIAIIFPEKIRYEQIRAAPDARVVEIAPPVLLPNGHLTFTSLCANDSDLTDSYPISTIGYFSEENKYIPIRSHIAQTARNFLKNTTQYCNHCSAWPYCQGRNENFTQFMLNNTVNNIDTYACEITRALYQVLDA